MRDSQAANYDADIRDENGHYISDLLRQVVHRRIKMTGGIHNNRWQVTPDDFAIRVSIADVPGMLSKVLIVPPGVRAVIIDGDQMLGEVPPGEYALQSVEDRLSFWKKRQSTAVLTRMEDVALNLEFRQLPTEENLLVDVDLRLTLQVNDAVRFLHNFMGARDLISRSDLQEDLKPIVHRAIWDTIRKSSISDLSKPGLANRLAEAVDESLQQSFIRYGLNFVDIQMVNVRHEKYDKLQQREGVLELIRKGVEQKVQLDELYQDDELRQIRKGERQNELRVLAAQVETDAMESRLAAKIERIEVEQRIAETLDAERFEKLKSKEDLRDLLLQIDTRRVMRQSQLDELVDGYSKNKDDRKEARRHFLLTLEVQRDQELAELRQAINHASEMRTVEHEIALADRIATQESAQWKRELEKSKTEEDLQDEREQKRSASQLNRLAQLQELNRTDRESRKRLDSDLAGNQNQRDIDRMKVMGELKSDALIASANPENAALLAQVKKQEATGLNDAERQALYQRLSASEREKADAIARVYQQTSELMQKNVKDVLDATIRTFGGAAAAPPPPPPTDTRWFVSMNGQQTGPFNSDQLRQQARDGAVHPHTYIWRQGIEWTAAKSIPEFSSVFAERPPAPPDSR